MNYRYLFELQLLNKISIISMFKMNDYNNNFNLFCYLYNDLSKYYTILYTNITT